MVSNNLCVGHFGSIWNNQTIKTRGSILAICTITTTVDILQFINWTASFCTKIFIFKNFSLTLNPFAIAVEPANISFRIFVCWDKNGDFLFTWYCKVCDCYCCRGRNAHSLLKIVKIILVYFEQHIWFPNFVWILSYYYLQNPLSRLHKKKKIIVAKNVFLWYLSDKPHANCLLLTSKLSTSGQIVRWNNISCASEVLSTSLNEINNFFKK